MIPDSRQPVQRQSWPGSAAKGRSIVLFLAQTLFAYAWRQQIAVRGIQVAPGGRLYSAGRGLCRLLNAGGEGALGRWLVAGKQVAGRCGGAGVLTCQSGFLAAPFRPRCHSQQRRWFNWLPLVAEFKAPGARPQARPRKSLVRFWGEDPRWFLASSGIAEMRSNSATKPGGAEEQSGQRSCHRTLPMTTVSWPVPHAVPAARQAGEDGEASTVRVAVIRILGGHFAPG